MSRIFRRNHIDRLFRAIFPIFIILTSSFSFNISDPYPLCNTFYIKKLSLSYFPDIQLGTHQIGIGYNGEIQLNLPYNITRNNIIALGLAADVNGMFYGNNWGLPGQSLSLEPGAAIRLEWGSPSKFGNSKWLRGALTQHSLSYRYSHYLSNDKTSQFYAEYLYELNISNYKIILGVGNDDLTFLKTDRFRSAAVDLSLFKNQTSSLIGLSIGLKLWHGDYSSQLYLDRNQTYNFDGIYGGTYSLGLLYLAFNYNYIKIGLGYDSDKIRVFFQNHLHKIMNNGMVPNVNRPDKIYLQLSLFGNNGQY